MEDTDNFEPDSSGTLMDLKYQGLSVVDPQILSYTNLVYLDVSFNLLESLPDEISLLQNLEELHCCSNKIAVLPESIGSIQSLRLIKANNNMLISLPKSIGQLQSLKSLVLSDNIWKLTQLDVSRNDEQLQTTLPAQIHQDAQSILWLLALQREKTHCIETLKTDVKLLQHQIHSSSAALAEAKQKIASELEQKKKALEDDFESVRYFLTFRYLCRELRRKALELWQSVRRACAKKYSERQARVSEAQVDAV